MNGKVVGLGLIACMLAAGAGMWYAQVYAYYDRLPGDAGAALVMRDDAGAALALNAGDFQGIDSTSSPLRYRACFTLPGGVPAGAAPYPAPTPTIAPGWFGCFDAATIGADLESGRARAWLAQENLAPGVDRVIATYPDGRAYAWHQLNESAEEKKVLE